MSDIAIKVENLSKMYRLGVINNGTLFRDIQTWFALKSGKQDPHSKIGDKRFEGDEDHFWALKNINFDINKGDRIGIIGNNGAGKSTLLKILSRVTTPSEGKAFIKGRISSLLEVGTGFNAELTGRENIYLNGAILGMSKKQIDNKLEEIIDFSGIDHHIDTPVKRYSSGMYVRLAFAVAAHLDSEVLIADEVLAVGDVEFQKKALGKMQQLSDGYGKTVLFVSHNITAVRQLCNKGLVLDSGKIVHIGNIDKSLEVYLGENVEFGKFDANKVNQKNKQIAIKAFYLSDENDNGKNKINNNELVYVNILANISDYDKNVYIGFRLYTAEGECLFRSSNIDLENENCNVLKIGLVHLKCILPTSILTPGQYNLNIEAAIFNQEWIINPDTEKQFSINFQIVDRVFGARYRTPGKISPPIVWQVEYK